MKVKKHPQLNINLAHALSRVRFLLTLTLFLFASSFPAKAVPSQETTNLRTFADWCLNKHKESVETKHTINVLLQVAKTPDCHQALKLLSTRSALYLGNNRIADLKPLSELTNLVILDLNDNQITDLKPLSSLTSLTYLSLENNQIANLKPLSGLTNLAGLSLNNNSITDLKPLSGLTNLTGLFLGNNQITDLKPLSTLTNLSGLFLENNSIASLKPLSTLANLTSLFLGNNQTLTDKTCPVKPESICEFHPFTR
jgi:internalin A